MRTVTNSFYCMKGVRYDETKYRDLNGEIVENNPMEYPYSYDTYVIYKSPFFKKTDTKYYFGSGPGNSEKELNALKLMGIKRLSCENYSQVEIFLSIILERDVVCTAITKGCFGGGNPNYTVYIK